ncbi:hypothetical protein ACJJTC_012416 [Scirpophaga incertulas]
MHATHKASRLSLSPVLGGGDAPAASGERRGLDQKRGNGTAVRPEDLSHKLQTKYPMLYSILQNEASPELKQRVDRDRNKTTYRVDYCESGPGAKFEGLQRAADESGAGPCAQPMRLPGDPCRVGPKPRHTTPRTMSKQPSAGAEPRAKCETTSAVPPLGKTEYQDGVAKLGAIIMRDKLHRR